jgi:hypothetical protein
MLNYIHLSLSLKLGHKKHTSDAMKAGAIFSQYQHENVYPCEVTLNEIFRLHVRSLLFYLLSRDSGDYVRESICLKKFILI